jgi:hypothetical protein
MSSKPVWNFRPSEQAEEIVSRIEENVQTVNSRSEAINLLLRLQADLVETGGMDMVFSMMAMEEPVVIAESERERLKSIVKEAIVELEDGSGASSGNKE